ncbi:protein CLAVATA 3 [Capsella rubella]|uniref:protein CLAVATA 3 n=1 Tax=Capsella rubella TaxID=81985 RepID=UPI000CD4FDEE|nr:protein CLAVATA 3 [Capsella rubella]
MDSSRSLVLLLLFCLLFLHDASDLTQAHGHVTSLPTRKMMMMNKGSETVGANEEKEEKKIKGLGLNEELRTVPSGPDPLHHHVNPPRQPRNHSLLP